jgi:amino acid adenylation domain-containing protein
VVVDLGVRGTTRADLPTVPDLFRRQAEATPDAPAVACAGVELPYRTLSEHADRVAAHLRESGVGPGSLVGVHLERGVDLLVALLGILRSGAAYVPLDPGFPAQRLADMVSDAGVRVVLTGRTPVKWLTDPAVRLVPISQALRGDRPTTEFPVLRPGDLAYVIYTSGSTGRPKGVMIPHRALTNFMRSMRERPGLDARAVLLAVTTVCFDIAALELFLPLLVGGRVVIAGTDEVADPQRLAGLIRDKQATVMQATPATWQMLRTIRWSPPPEFTILCGGEKLPPDLAAWFASVRPSAAWDLYGPTETTIWSTTARLDDEGRANDWAPVANTPIHVLDERLRAVPEGEDGELYIGGAGLARGYHDRPALTAARFRPDPYSGEPGARLYRTGDVARRLPDGSVVILGRTDHQIKVRGFRIESGEVEVALTAHPAVRQAVVVARPDHRGENQLVAYVARTDRSNPTPMALPDHVRQQLPAYMVPAVFVVVDAFPLNLSGKVDRAALPEPRLEDAPGRPEHSPASTAMEETVAGVWREVLHLDRVGMDDDFFDLGGHSLVATAMLARLREILGPQVSLSVLLENPTPADQARALEQLDGDAVEAGRITIRPRPDQAGGLLPLSPSQRRLWFVDQEKGTGCPNATLLAYRVHGPLDVTALRVAIERIVERHEALRTVFPAVDGAPAQRVVDPPGFALIEHDLTRAAPGDDREVVARRMLADESAVPFDLGTGPLMRVMLVRLSHVEHLVLFHWHHIVVDGWSQGVFLRELAAGYDAAVAGAAPQLPALPIQFRDYAAWQERTAGGDEAQLAYWRDRLAGAPGEVTFPADHLRPADPTGRGAHLSVELATQVTDGLRAACARQRVTAFAALLAGFAVLLSRYAATDDVVVGAPVAGRTRREVEDLIGFFVNTLVLRLDVRGPATVGELLTHVQAAVTAAQAHQDVPFERLVEAMRPNRRHGRHPLFQVMFNLEGAETGTPALGALSVDEVPVESGVSRFDAVVTVRHRARRPDVVELEYSTELFEPATAARILAHYGEILRALAAARPEDAVSTLDMRTGAERAELTRWNATGVPYPAGTRVHDLVEESVARLPGATAVVAGDGSLSYAELNRRANRLAHHLRALGAIADSLVGVYLSGGVAATTALLGVLKSGAAYLPLDPNHPAERLARVIAANDVRIVVTDEALGGRVPTGPDTAVVCLDSDAELAGRPVHDPPPVALPDNLAYAITTSGSTGLPKCVLLPHRALVNLIRWQSGAQLAGVRTAQLASLAFDVSFQEIFIPLSTGGQVTVPPAAYFGDPERLAAWLDEAGIEQIILTPTLLDHVAGCLRRSARVPASLAEVTVTGEAITITPAIRWLLSASGAVLHNQYGPSETHCAMAYRCAGEPGAWAAHPPIGRPISNKRVYLLDGELRPVPIGVPGEIYLGGVGLARGYAGATAATADRFRPDPFSPEPGARMYRTGDIGRLRADGTVGYLGRADHQIKIRGVRIEPGEVEAALVRQPGVRAAAIAVHQPRPGDSVLAAYVVPVGDEAVDATRLRAALRRELPDYLIPSVYRRLDTLPLTATGKLDRAALPAIEGVEPVRDQAYLPPRTATEQAVAAIWTQVLPVDRVGVHDDFFTIGGHSLLATQIATRLRAAFAVEVSIRDVISVATVGGLADLVRRRSRETPVTTPALRDVIRADPVPLSAAQARLWFLDQLQPSRRDYHLPQVLRLRGPLDIAALTVAVRAIVARHEVLRTRYVVRDDDPVQVIEPPGPVDLDLVDLSELPADEREGRATESVAQACFPDFDLETGPVFRATVIRLAPREHLAVFTVHHIASDGWSLRLFDQELERLYAAWRAPAATDPTRPAVQYAEFATWEAMGAADGSWEPLLAYWQRTLTGVEPLNLPTDRPRPRVWDTRAGLVRRYLPVGLCDHVRSLARQRSATPFMVLFAGYLLVLSRRSGQQDLTVGTPSAGRDEAGTGELIGCFVNTLAMRSRVPQEAPFADLVDRVRAMAMEAYEHQRVPFDRVVQRVRPERDLSRHPLFDVLFTMTEQSSLRLAALDVEALPVQPQGTSFDLSLEVEQRLDGSFKIELEYAAALFDAGTAEDIAAQYGAALAAACAEPHRPVGDLAW